MKPRLLYFVPAVFVLAASMVLPLRADMVLGMPDLKQQQFGKMLPRDGFAYCGPTAVANILLWLENHRMTEVSGRLVSSDKVDRIVDRRRTYNVREAGYLVRSLGQYMRTDEIDGTPPKDLLRGLERYFRDKARQPVEVTYEGIREIDDQYRLRDGPPSMARLQRSVRDGAFAVVNVGWYKHDSEKNRYVRKGGHWVTMAGWRQHNGKNYLVVHDPANRPKWLPSGVFLRPVALPGGTLTGKPSGLPAKASGMYELKGSLGLIDGTDTAVLEGVVYIEPQEIF